jgi:hypothetical protein
MKSNFEIQSYLAVPVETRLYHIRIIDATKFNIPDAKVKAGPPGQEWNFKEEKQKKKKME